MKARVHVVGGAAQGRIVELDEGQPIVVGRGTDAQLSVPADTALSRAHAQLVLSAGAVHATDLKSRHGMFVNGARQDAAVLADGHRVQVGETVLRVEIYDPLAATKASVAHTARGWAPAASAGSGAMVTVRCRCGAASSEPARPAGEDVVFMCESCQASYASAPVLPDGYALVRVLGRGAMGSVYLARESGTGALRAIKQILPRAAMSAAMRKMFAREAAVQAVLDHPNVVRVYGLIEPIPGAFSLLMEYVEGDSAEALLRGGATVSPALAIAIGCQTLDGLAHAHARQIVHRDIKEANLMLVRAPGGGVTVKIADFGLAKNFYESGASGITTDGALGGTLPYMSNEQLLDFKYVKPPADIYALGATLYRLLTGLYPRDFAEGANWIRVALEEPIVPLASRPAGASMPRALCAVVEKALEPDVKRRYQSAAEMRHALAAVAI